MTNEIFSVKGNKIATFYLDDYSFKFSSKEFNSKEDFEESFHKKLTLATKSEIEHDSIKSIQKEDTDENVVITYKSTFGNSTCLFSFNNADDYRTFFTYVENELGLQKEEETLTPFKALSKHIFGLAITIAITLFSYYEAIEIANGTAPEATTSKARTFDNIVGLLGDKGVLLVGGLITCYIIFQMWKRSTNPPTLMKFT